MTNKKIILIVGPTATGKTKLSLDLAKKFSLPIVNADSLQFYNELNIGVAKPTLEELAQAPHYLINCASISKPLNAKSYRDLALVTFERLWRDQSYPALILTGGSGFYLKALLYGMYESISITPAIVEKSNALYHEKGITGFLEILKEVDTESFQKLHPNDHYRIRRAVEHWWLTHTPFSAIGKIQEKKNQENPFWKEQGWQILTLYTDVPKDIHQKIIEERTESMLRTGLIQEVQNLLKIFSGLEKPLQSIGYKEVQEYLSGKIKSLEELKLAIIISTRQLAKAQRTWFASVDKVKLNYPNFNEEASILCQKFLI